MAGAVAAALLVPLALVATRSWWVRRPARTGADHEHAVTGWWMRACVGLLALLIVLVVVLELVDLARV